MEFKHNSTYSGSIHSIRIDPILVHYWSDHQIIIYKDARKEYCRLSIDATGGLVKKIQRTSLNLSSAYIFLYEALISSSFGQLPVTQMLSEKQDTLTIWNWLAQWNKYVLHEPNETVCDYSKAILGALTRAFCDGMKLSTYIHACFLILSGNNDIKLPKCYIRLDVAHVIKIFCRFNCFSEKNNKYLKEYYVRGLRLLLTTEEFLEFKTLLEALLTVIMCETDGWLIDCNTTEMSPSEKCRKYILHQIKTKPRNDCFDKEMNQYINNNESTGTDILLEINPHDNENNLETSNIDQFLNKIKEISYQNSKITGNKDFSYKYFN